MMQVFTVFTTALSLPLAWASPQKYVNTTVGRIVETSSGPVAGHAATNFSEVSEYLGIPFAQAPVGNLRFAAPVRYTGSALLNGSDYGFSCPELPSEKASYTGSEIAAANITQTGLNFFDILTDRQVVHNEDCLSLNIWTKQQSREPQKAVMIFIHGGGFDSGTSDFSISNGASLADEEDVIIVTINYRLSILGWPGNPKAQNNVAFLDQRLAVEWVQENIAGFGGDPTRITLFGQSAGAESIDNYVYAWASDPIVTGIILESGSAFSLGIPISPNVSAANWYNTSATLGCGDASTNSTALLECMRTVDIDSLMSAIPTTGLNALFSAFGPTVDNVLVFSNYSEQIPANIPVLLGSNDYEAGNSRTTLGLSNAFYPDSLWDAYNLASFTCPLGQRANASVAANVSTWRYRFFGVFPDVNISSEGGAYHGIELPLIFGTANSFSPLNATAEEVNFKTYLRGAWTTFAKDPVNGLKTYEGGWPLYDPAEETLVRLGYENLVGPNLAFPILYDAGCSNASLAALECTYLGVNC